MTTTLVTGSNRGLGLALARLSQERGDNVIAVCRRSSAELDGLGVRVECDVDVADDSSVNELAQRLEQKFFANALLACGQHWTVEMPTSNSGRVSQLRRDQHAHCLVGNAGTLLKLRKDDRGLIGVLQGLHCL